MSGPVPLTDDDIGDKSLTSVSSVLQYVSILRPPMDEDGRIIQLSDLYTSTTSSSSEWRQVIVSSSFLLRERRRRKKSVENNRHTKHDELMHVAEAVRASDRLTISISS